MFGLTYDSAFNSNFLIVSTLGNSSAGSSDLVTAMSGRLAWIPGTWSPPNPASAVLCIWGINQPTETHGSLSFFQINLKKMYIYKLLWIEHNLAPQTCAISLNSENLSVDGFKKDTCSIYDMWKLDLVESLSLIMGWIS